MPLSAWPVLTTCPVARCNQKRACICYTIVLSERVRCIFNPQCMHEGCSSRSVCVSVCYQASCYIPRLWVQFVVLQGSLWCSKCMICVDFAENALFASFLTFQASSSMTLRINRALYVVHYIRYVRITNLEHMRSRHGYNNNNHWCWSTRWCHGELSTDDMWLLSNSKGIICMVSYTCRSNKMTGSSLIGAQWQISFLASNNRLLTWPAVHTIVIIIVLWYNTAPYRYYTIAFLWYPLTRKWATCSDTCNTYSNYSVHLSRGFLP